MELQEFCRYWPQAQAKGWVIVKAGDLYLVSPPARSPVSTWAAIWQPLNFGGLTLSVPHWYVKVVTTYP